MIIALYILLALIVAGAVLKITDRHSARPADSETAPTPEPQPQSEECCGMHITCEKDSLLTAMADKVEYFDDEELDRFAGRAATDYSEAEIEEFRDVLLTLRPDDIAPWARSVQLRGIVLPEPVLDELYLIVSEARAARAASPGRHA